MINQFIFSDYQNLEYELPEDWQSRANILFDKVGSDPYMGIGDWKKLNTRVVSYTQKNGLNFYFRAQFIQGFEFFRSMYPYFKGEIRERNGRIFLAGRIGFSDYHNYAFLIALALFIGVILVNQKSPVVVLFFILGFGQLGYRVFRSLKFGRELHEEISKLAI